MFTAASTSAARHARLALPVACALALCATACGAVRHCDFNGDGFDDLAIAMPNRDVGAFINAGAVQVLYGSAGGVRYSGAQLFTQDSPGLPDIAANSDRFGSALAWGDFNHDGFDDLAIGSAYDDVGGNFNRPDTGSVTVIYGSVNGLDAEGIIDAQYFRQGAAGMRDNAETNDLFGWSLAAGDFDGDGFDDLAIGVIGEDLPAATDAGAVQIIYGDASGLDSFGNELWTLNSGGVPEASNFGDRLGYALAVGDFNDDGRDDLAIGAPARAVALTPGFGFADRAGAVFIIKGSVTGLTGSGSQIWTQSSSGIDGFAEPNDNFGYALAAGDFNNDGRDDLAIGEPFAEVNGFIDVGAVHVLYGSNTGLSSAGSVSFTDGGSNSSGQGALFGFALASGDFDRDGDDDLAVSAPRQPSGFVASAGAVFVHKGSSSDGLSSHASQLWTQDSQGIHDACETNDRFGEALWTGDFNGDHRADIAVGSPREDIGAFNNSGAVNVIYGSKNGLTARGDQFLAPGLGASPLSAEVGGFFGMRVTVTP